MIHLPLPNQHSLRIEEIVPPSPDLAFDFDPSAETAVSDALFLRSALHYVPLEHPDINPVAVEDAAETTTQAIQASLTLFKTSILKGAGITLAAESTPAPEEDPDQSVRFVPNWDVDEEFSISEEEWLAGMKKEVEAARHVIPFTGEAAAIALTGLRAAEHLRPGDFSPEIRAVRKMARGVAERYFHESHLLRNMLSRTMDLFTLR